MTKEKNAVHCESIEMWYESQGITPSHTQKKGLNELYWSYRESFHHHQWKSTRVNYLQKLNCWFVVSVQKRVGKNKRKEWREVWMNEWNEVVMSGRGRDNETPFTHTDNESKGKRRREMSGRITKTSESSCGIRLIRGQCTLSSTCVNLKYRLSIGRIEIRRRRGRSHTHGYNSEVSMSKSIVVVQYYLLQHPTQHGPFEICWSAYPLLYDGQTTIYPTEREA